MSQEYTPQSLEVALQKEWAETGRFSVSPDDAREIFTAWPCSLTPAENCIWGMCATTPLPT